MQLCQAYESILRFTAPQGLTLPRRHDVKAESFQLLKFSLHSDHLNFIPFAHDAPPSSEQKGFGDGISRASLPTVGWGTYPGADSQGRWGPRVVSSLSPRPQHVPITFLTRTYILK